MIEAPLGVEIAHVGVDSSWEFFPPTDPPASFAEESAEKILKCVQPTLDSEERRRDVIDYIQHLLANRLNCEVVSYGSVPLKTYLPEGDIDLTVFRGPNDEEALIHDVLAVVQEEEKNRNSAYELKEIQFIDAEVKLVKCLFWDIVIDISCNQLGGISTLCFLEKVDRFIGRNHLFKRSIILIKTWCYYESRILGAHHGLFSTYALEVLVLYIFHFFHSSLTGPLSVLRKFLDYYSHFDWDKYCINLKGPVFRSALPETVVDMSERPSENPLLGEKFLESCIGMFSTTCREQGSSKPFQMKHLNIMDPLKENNNLGRSVNIGNFYRIRSAFKYGSCKLGQILSQSREDAVDGIRYFFANTYERNGHRNRRIIKSLASDSSFADESGTIEIASDSCSVEASIDGSGALDDVSSGTYSIESLESHQFTSWLENRHHSDNYSENTTSSSFVTRFSENTDCREMDIDDDEECEALADLNGDYDNHIRSLLHGRISLSGTQIMNSRFKCHRKTQGTGTYFPNKVLISAFDHRSIDVARMRNKFSNGSFFGDSENHQFEGKGSSRNSGGIEFRRTVRLQTRKQGSFVGVKER